MRFIVPIGIVPSMDNIENIIAELEAFAAATGVTTSSVCRRATGNARLHDRLKRRSDKTQEDIGKLRSYMAEFSRRPKGDAFLSGGNV